MPPLDSIPEMDLEVLIRIMRTSFAIVTETVIGKPYAIRFVGSPYNPFAEDCRSVQIFTHNKGRSVSPLNTKAVLAKFEISEADFLEAGFGSGNLQVVSENAQDAGKVTKPN